MNKLGFAIKVVSDGVYEPLVCNKGSWFKKVIDPRHYLRMFSGLVGTENIVTAMSFSEYGCYIMLLRDIPGHAGDCLSAWLFIPCNVDDDEQVMGAYYYAKNVLAQSSIEAIKNETYDFFDKGCHVKNIYSQYTPSSGELLGVRYFNGEEELKELLGRKRYQEYYSRYKAVFLINRKEEVNVRAEAVSSFQDLTKFPLEEYCVLMPPTERELSEMGQGTKVIFQDGRTFDAPISKKKGERVELFARRKGFEDVRLGSVLVDRTIVQFPYGKHLEWVKKINKAFFDIRNHDGKNVESATIIVADYDVTKQSVLLPEKECRSARVQVSALGYEPLETHVNFLELHDKLTIKLHRSEKSDSYKIYLKNGKLADVTFTSKDLHGLENSPLEGYTFDKGNLSIDPFYKLKYWFYGVLTFFVIGIIVAGCKALDDYDFQFGWPPFKERTPPITNDSTQIPTADMSETIGYLNDNGKWSKAALDTLSLPGAEGLYDYLRQYQFEKLINMPIEGCKRFDEVKKVARDAFDNTISMPEPYSDSPDSTITISKWIDKVKREIKRSQNAVVDNSTSMTEEPTVQSQSSSNNLKEKIKRKKRTEKSTSSKKNDASSSSRNSNNKPTKPSPKEQKNGGLG